MKIRLLTDSELKEAYEKHLKPSFPETAYHRFIHIPWDITMGMPEQLPWEE